MRRWVMNDEGELIEVRPEPPTRSEREHGRASARLFARLRLPRIGFNAMILMCSLLPMALARAISKT